MRTISPVYEVKIRNNGKTFSRHYNADSPNKAGERAKGLGKIISVRKLHPEDIIGTIKSMRLEDVIRIPIASIERKQNVILDNVSISDIIFNKRSDKEKRSERRFIDGKQREKGE